MALDSTRAEMLHIRSTSSPWRMRGTDDHREAENEFREKLDRAVSVFQEDGEEDPCCSHRTGSANVLALVTGCTEDRA